MVIADTDLLIKYTGGAANSDGNASLGGTVSSNGPTSNSLHNLFDEVSGTESLAGDIEYRCVALKNNHGSLTAKSTKIYISADTSSYYDLALDGNGLNAAPESVGNESTAPSGESFTHPTTYSGGLSMGNIPNGQYYPYWIRRTIPAAASAATPYNLTVNHDCDSDA